MLKKGKNISKRICYCHDVDETTIRNFLEKNEVSFENLARNTGVGSKCTACLLDVELILEEYNLKKVYHISSNLNSNIQPPWKKDKTKNIFKNNEVIPHIGFFLNNKEVSTKLIVPNHGLLFNENQKLSNFFYKLIIRNKDGRKTKYISGILKKESVFNINFDEIIDLPNYGWFMFILYAKQEGFLGTTRPQILFRGKNWAATIHPQQITAADYGKFVSNEILENSVPLIMAINVIKKSSRLNITITYKNGEKEQKSIKILPYGAELINIRNIFSNRLKNEPLIINAESDTPIQKFILNKHSNHRYDIDHFPNR